MIGYSLSFCVSDIINGKMRLEDVEKIVANTCARDDFDWKKVVDTYCASLSAWRKNEERVREIVKFLIDHNKIEQPRVNNPSYCNEKLRDGQFWTE